MATMDGSKDMTILDEIGDPIPAKQSIDSKMQHLLDRASPHIVKRWIFYFIVLTLFMARVVLMSGWYIVAYALGIYLINQFMAFLTPQIDPESVENDELSLPTNSSDEYRPFARRLPEFKFWLSCLIATLISSFLTLFTIFDVPVFWPLLLFYWLILFISTMHKKILHMIKYRYMPFEIGGKTVYANAGKISESDNMKYPNNVDSLTDRL